jgi:predicted nuclease with TOPRIM domain
MLCKVAELEAKNEILRQAIETLGNGCSKFEHLYNLEKDKTEDLRQQVAVLEWKVCKLHALTNTTDYDLGNYEDDRIG